MIICRVACGLARSSSGSLNAALALARHWSSSAGYTPCSRHYFYPNVGIFNLTPTSVVVHRVVTTFGRV